MTNLEQYFCSNEQCKEYGLRGHGNISVRAKYGKEKSRVLLYCRTCGKRFAAKGVGVRATARLLELDKDTVNRVVLRAGEHCAKVLSELLTSLEMTEVQLDELWTFVKKENSGSAEDLEHQYGQTWIWTAIDAPTRSLITFWIGGRKLDDARRMLKDLTTRLEKSPCLSRMNCPITEQF